MRKIQSGFLLLERIVVVGLFAVIFGIGMINVHFLDQALVRTELDKLYAVCLYLQHNARVENKSYTLYFDANQKTYTCDSQRWNLPSQIIFGTLEGTKGPPSSPHNSVKNPITFKKSCITFSPQGIIQPGTIYLTDSRRCYGYALSCSVSDYSYIRRYRYDTQWHMLI